MSHPILTDAQTRMKKSVDHTLHEFSSLHTGKASPAMVEGIMESAAPRSAPNIRPSPLRSP